MIEVDVRVTSDGQVVLVHDGTVDGSTDGAGEVASLTFEYVRGLDAGGHRGDEFAGECVPTLAEAIEAVRGRAMLNLDLKDGAAVAPMVRAVRDHGALADVVVTGCGEAWAALVHAEDRSLPVFLNMDGELQAAAATCPSRLAETAVERCLRAGLRGLNFHHTHVSPELVRYAHARGVGVWTWTVDDPARMRELAEIGVDAITSNDPVALTRALGSAA